MSGRTMNTLKIAAVILLLLPARAGAQEIVNLYPGDIPNARVNGVKEVYDKCYGSYL